MKSHQSSRRARVRHPQIRLQTGSPGGRSAVRPADGQMSVYTGGPPGGSTDFIIDITGFYQ
jgi:hypothetical protein